MRRRPAIGGSEIGAATGKANVRPVVSQCFSGKYPPRNRAANSGSQWALSAPLSPVNSGKPTGTIRPATGVTGAPLPHQATREHQGIASASGTALRTGTWPATGTAHRSRGNYVRTSEAWPTSAPYRSRETTPDLPRGRTAHGNLPKPATYRHRSEPGQGIGG
jgi:hypothetical protein